MFFVISGFLISTIILKQLRRSTFTLAGFYARRARRILPALGVVLMACVLFGWFALLPDEFEYLGKHVAAAAAFASNFALWLESGYFDPAAEFKPLLHLWSLGIEEQFYLAWPVFLLLLWRRRLNIGIIIGLLVAASFTLNVALAEDKPTANFYFPLSRFWELGLGCLLALTGETPAGPRQLRDREHALHRQFALLRSRAAWALPIIGIALIVVALFCLDTRNAFPGWAALLPTAGAVCVISSSGDAWFARRVMAHPVLVFVGLISYPLYLWHWPILSFATILEAGTPAAPVRVAALLLSFALAWLTFQFIELPVRTHRRLSVSLALASGVVMLGSAGLLAYATSGFSGRFDFDVRRIAQGPSRNPLCTNTFDNRNFNYCKSTSSAAPDVVFLGDSQAQAVYDGTVAVLGDTYDMMLLGRGGCPPLLNVDVYSLGKESRNCHETWNAFLEHVRSVKPRVVILVGQGSHHFEASKRHGMELESKDLAFEEGLSELVAALRETSRVIYVREIPFFESAPTCFLRPIQLPGSRCSPVQARSTVEQRMASYQGILARIQAEFPELLVVDSIPVLCGPTVCSQTLDSGEILYSDAMHLSPAGGRRFVEESGLTRMILEAMHSSADRIAQPKHRLRRSALRSG